MLRICVCWVYLKAVLPLPCNDPVFRTLTSWLTSWTLTSCAFIFVTIIASKGIHVKLVIKKPSFYDLQIFKLPTGQPTNFNSIKMSGIRTANLNTSNCKIKLIYSMLCSYGGFKSPFLTRKFQYTCCLSMTSYIHW